VERPIEHIRLKYGWCLSLYITYTHARAHARTHTNTHLLPHFKYTSPSAFLWTHSSLSYPLIPPISKPPIQSTSPQFSYLWYLIMFILLFSSHLRFPILSQIFFRLFPKIAYNISYEHILTRTCVRCLVVQQTDTEWFWALTARVPKRQRISNRTSVTAKDGSISGVLHIITHGTRYTEHTVDVHSNRT
jgi:hypothetical protein